MLSDSVEEKEKQKDGLISRWLAERNELLVLYCRLTGKRKGLVLPEQEQIIEFCDILIDYVSAGHFEIYEEVVGRCHDRGPESLKLLTELFPKISHTTDIVVDFNDKYSKQLTNEQLIPELDKDLSRLGEAIASRVELEDKLIETLNTHH